MRAMNASDSATLFRTLGLFPATNLVIADMIGAGIFTTSGLLLTELGSPILMIALWAVGGLLALCGALCYGALGAAMPRAGGEYVYLSRQFHPIFGFLTGWCRSSPAFPRHSLPSRSGSAST
jgi:APA family basic amino acid/polyamine antiporter